jgi:aryl-alcohol dehydrogenase-like predicted oxidoreductase
MDDEEEIFKLLKYAYDQGIRTFDTADTYSNGDSERLIGKFIKKFNINRSTIVILSKVCFPCDDDPDIVENEFKWINRQGLSRKHVFDAVEASVGRLGTYLDVLQIHRLDKSTSKEEIMEALHDVVKSGNVRYIGASSMRATEFAQLQFTAEKNHWTKFISMQNFYNLIYREEEREMIPFCNDTGIGLIPWSPIARGILARPSGGNSLRSESDPFIQVLNLGGSQSDKIIIGRVEDIARSKGISMAQVAIAWTIAKGCAPIVGLSSEKRIDEAVGAVKVKLTEEELKYLEELYEAHAVQAI